MPRSEAHRSPRTLTSRGSWPQPSTDHVLLPGQAESWRRTKKRGKLFFLRQQQEVPYRTRLPNYQTNHWASEKNNSLPPQTCRLPPISQISTCTLGRIASSNASIFRQILIPPPPPSLPPLPQPRRDPASIFFNSLFYNNQRQPSTTDVVASIFVLTILPSAI